jgi:hypothetical protein
MVLSPHPSPNPPQPNSNRSNFICFYDLSCCHLVHNMRTRYFKCNLNCVRDYWDDRRRRCTPSEVERGMQETRKERRWFRRHDKLHWYRTVPPLASPNHIPVQSIKLHQDSKRKRSVTERNILYVWRHSEIIMIIVTQHYTMTRWCFTGA